MRFRANLMVFSIFLAWYFFLFDIINSYVYYKLRANWIFFKNNRTSFPLVKLYFFDIKLLIRAKIFTTVRYFCIFVLREYNSWRGGTRNFKNLKNFSKFTIYFIQPSYFFFFLFSDCYENFRYHYLSIYK